MRPPFLILLWLFFASNLLLGNSEKTIQNEYPIYLEGKIKKKNISMHLRQLANKLDGYYSIHNKGKTPLNGYVYSSGNIQLIELNSSGKQIGEFIGTIQNHSIQGHWKKSTQSNFQDLSLNFLKGSISLDYTPNNYSSNQNLNSQTDDGYHSTPIIIDWGLLVFLTIMIIIARLIFKQSKGKKHLRENSRKPSYLSSAQKGREFENFVSEIISQNKFHKILEWRGDKFHNGISAMSNTYPDFLVNVSYPNFNANFSIECKYRSQLVYPSFRLCKDSNITNYKRYARDQKVDVFMVLGVAGSPSNPRDIYIIPIHEFDSGEISTQKILQFKDENPRERFYYKPDMNKLVLCKASSK